MPAPSDQEKRESECCGCDFPIAEPLVLLPRLFGGEASLDEQRCILSGQRRAPPVSERQHSAKSSPSSRPSASSSRATSSQSPVTPPGAPRSQLIPPIDGDLRVEERTQIRCPHTLDTLRYECERCSHPGSQHPEAHRAPSPVQRAQGQADIFV